ncbi:MAG: hypothetical protein ACK2VD_26115 [Anaerolineae bacterium]
MSLDAKPLALPDDFDPAAYLPAKTTENGIYHESRRGARLAAQLVANGTPQDLQMAERVLDAVLACQERHPDDPHCGNFCWMAEDEVVEDLNAVEFNLQALTPMMIRHGERLPPHVRARVLEAIRLGLREIERLDVLVAYSNIAVLDIVNTSLGGELLGDARVAARGYRKLVEWMAFTDQYGVPFEYNSPTYTSVIIRALKLLADLTRDRATRIRAHTAAARLGLSVALHIHPATGRWAGPHSRAYHPTVACETEPERAMFERWIEDRTLPDWLDDALNCRPREMQVDETAYPERDMSITTYHSRSFALGTAASGFGGQANAMMVHYARSDSERPGVLYTRYLVNDKWLGDFYHATDRTRSRNLIDEGRFYGVQRGPHAIGLYTPSRLGATTSAKTALILTDRAAIDGLWVGQTRIGALPMAIAPGEVLVIESGRVRIALLPLARTALGRSAPARAVERNGDLVVELYNYSGPEKRFWELDWPGAFYQGTPQCGFYLEVTERDAHVDAPAFAQAVSAGQVLDRTAPPRIYDGRQERCWAVEYAREGTALGIEVDLMAWRLKRRWTEAGEIGWPMLDAPVAQETRDGQAIVGDARLTCGREAGWLFACPERKRWVAAYHGLQPAPLELVVPGGRVTIEAMGTGLVIWDDGAVRIEALSMAGTPDVEGGVLSSLTTDSEGAHGIED